MAEVVERKQPTKIQAQQLTETEKELRAMQAYIKEITSSKKRAEAFLLSAGIVDKQGQLAKQYRR